MKYDELTAMDCLIATFCIETRVPLLFEDRDFVPFVEHLNLQSAIGTS